MPKTIRILQKEIDKEKLFTCPHCSALDCHVYKITKTIELFSVNIDKNELEPSHSIVGKTEDDDLGIYCSNCNEKVEDLEDFADNY